MNILKPVQGLSVWLLVVFIMQHQVCASVMDVLKIAKKSVFNDMSSVKQPIASGISYIGTNMCNNLKNIMKVNYDHLKDSNEPDVGNMTVEYRSSDYRTQVPLRSAEKALPKIVVGFKTKLYLFLHGFTDNPQKDNFKTIHSALQKMGKINVLALDASSLIGWSYLRSTTYVRFIGAALGHVLAKLYYVSGLAPENIHLIGHSLGAHIAAFTAKEFHRATCKKVGRISGLDPAGPCFTDVDPSLRLNKNDAMFVDAYHTNGEVYGIYEPVGHADFYPNGGKQQPQCLSESCSHSFAVKLFAESVSTPDNFPALNCNSYEEFKKGKCSKEISSLGIAAAVNKHGRFYLQTNGKSPFARGKKGLTYVKTSGGSKGLELFDYEVLGWDKF